MASPRLATDRPKLSIGNKYRFMTNIVPIYVDWYSTEKKPQSNGMFALFVVELLN